MHRPWIPQTDSTGNRYPKFLKGAVQYMHDYNGMSEGECVTFVSLIYRIDIKKATVHQWLHAKYAHRCERVY